MTRADGRDVAEVSVWIGDYLGAPAGMGPGMLGEPEPHWYFHRPLHALFGIFFRAGFVLDGLEEPAFPAPDTEAGVFSWSSAPGIPPVLVARFVAREAAT